MALWLFQAIYTVQPDELAVELRFGKPKEELSQPGLHFHWWPIETVEKANTAEKLVDLGEVRGNTSSGLMLSGDQNIVDVQFSVAYQVVRSARPICSTSPIPTTWCARSAKARCAKSSAAVRRRTFSATTARASPTTVREIIQTTLDELRHRPRDQRRSRSRTRRRRAKWPTRSTRCSAPSRTKTASSKKPNQYANQKLGQARGEAAQIREDAAAYKNRVVQEAEGEAQRFISVYDEYAKAPEVTRKRLFLETMEQVLQGSNKVIVEQGSGQGVVPYLPLPELQPSARRATAGGAN